MYGGAGDAGAARRAGSAGDGADGYKALALSNPGGADSYPIYDDLKTHVYDKGLAAGAAFNREREGLGQLLGPYLIGLDATDIETARQRIREASYLGWSNYWLETAFWDIKGQAEGQPLWRMLGGDPARLPADRRVPVYASTGEVHPPEQRAEEVQALAEQGFGTVKLRVHDFDPAEYIRQVETVRRAVGDAMQIGVDANQGWPVSLIDPTPIWDLEYATEFAEGCAIAAAGDDAGRDAHYPAQVGADELGRRGQQIRVTYRVSALKTGIDLRGPAHHRDHPDTALEEVGLAAAVDQFVEP